MTLDPVRDAIDTCDWANTAAFARRTRNAIAMAIVAQRPDVTTSRTPPVERLREVVGDELAETLATVYEGGDEWASHALDALEPLHELSRS